MAQSLKQRVSQLEREVAELKGQVRPTSESPNPWVSDLFGVFRDDPSFKEATRLGKQFSKSLDAKPAKRKKNGHSRH